MILNQKIPSSISTEIFRLQILASAWSRIAASHVLSAENIVGTKLVLGLILHPSLPSPRNHVMDSRLITGRWDASLSRWRLGDIRCVNCYRLASPNICLISLGLQNLFVDDAEYDHWCSTIGSGSVQARLEFMAFAKLSQCAFVLVCGASNVVAS